MGLGEGVDEAGHGFRNRCPRMRAGHPHEQLAHLGAVAAAERVQDGAPTVEVLVQRAHADARALDELFHRVEDGVVTHTRTLLPRHSTLRGTGEIGKEGHACLLLRRPYLL